MIYHVFTNERDDWLEFKEAVELFRNWKNEHGCARMYSTEYNTFDDTYDDVDCVKSYGSWPI